MLAVCDQVRAVDKRRLTRSEGQLWRWICAPSRTACVVSWNSDLNGRSDEPTATSCRRAGNNLGATRDRSGSYGSATTHGDDLLPGIALYCQPGHIIARGEEEPSGSSLTLIVTCVVVIDIVSAHQ